jgi:phage-related protein
VSCLEKIVQQGINESFHLEFTYPIEGLAKQDVAFGQKAYDEIEFTIEYHNFDSGMNEDF